MKQTNKWGYVSMCLRKSKDTSSATSATETATTIEAAKAQSLQEKGGVV